MLMMPDLCSHTGRCLRLLRPPLSLSSGQELEQKLTDNGIDVPETDRVRELKHYSHHKSLLEDIEQEHREHSRHRHSEDNK